MPIRNPDEMVELVKYDSFLDLLMAMSVLVEQRFWNIDQVCVQCTQTVGVNTRACSARTPLE